MPRQSKINYDPASDYILVSLQKAKEAQDILKIASKHPPGTISKIPLEQLCDLSKQLTCIVNNHSHLSSFQEIPIDRNFWNRIEGIM